MTLLLEQNPAYIGSGGIDGDTSSCGRGLCPKNKTNCTGKRGDTAAARKLMTLRI